MPVVNPNAITVTLQQEPPRTMRDAVEGLRANIDECEAKIRVASLGMPEDTLAYSRSFCDTLASIRNRLNHALSLRDHTQIRVRKLEIALMSVRTILRILKPEDSAAVIEMIDNAMRIE